MQVWLLLAVALISSACAYPVSPGRYGGAAPTQTIELYDPGSKHTGYGKVQGETVEMFGPDGTRLGYGKIQGGTLEIYNPDGSRAGYGKKR